MGKNTKIEWTALASIAESLAKLARGRGLPSGWTVSRRRGDAGNEQMEQSS